MDSKILNFPLKVLQIPGLDPRDNSWCGKLKSFIAFTTAFVLLVTSVIQMHRTERNVTAIVPVIEAFMAAMQGLMRWFILFLFKKKLSKAMEDSKIFLDVKTADPEDESEADATLKMVGKGIRIYSVSVFTTGTVAVITPIVFGWGKVLPFVAWFPEKYTYGYEILYVTQTIYLLTTVSMVVGADSLFGAFCGQLIAQFKLLNKKFERVDHIKSNKHFISNMEEFGENLGNVYFSMLLGQYIITLSASCVELYMISESMNDFSQIARFISYMTTLLTQMGLFCFLAEALMEESMNTAVAAYNSDWYSRDIKETGLYVQMIIMRASKAVTFSGGGLITIGRVSFLNVFKMSFSVFTLLTSIK